MGLASSLALRLYRSRLAARWLFGARCPALVPGDRYFDASTLALRRCLRRRLPRGARVLEIGTGSFALLGRWMQRELGARVSCTELDGATVERARACVAAEGLPLEVREGSLFADLAGPFDFVVFNPPYVPSAVGEARGLSGQHRRQWDGGRDGSAVLHEFLLAFHERGAGARALVGLNERHVPRERLRQLLDGVEGLALVETHTQGWSPAVVHELRGGKL